MPIVGTDVVKAALRITTGAEDAALAVLVPMADQFVKRYCNRDFERTTYPGAAPGGLGDSGYYSGKGFPELRLRQAPVVSVASVYLDDYGQFGQNPAGSFGATTLLTAGQDYMLKYDGSLGGAPCSNSGVLLRVNDVWPAQYRRERGGLSSFPVANEGSIKVSYTAGYTADDMPADLVGAVCELVAGLRKWLVQGGPLQSQSLGAFSYSTFGPIMAGMLPTLGDVRSVLAMYRRAAV